MSVYRYRVFSTDPRFGRNVNHDSRSLAYRVPRRTAQTVLWTRNIFIFNQLDLGSCTGNAGLGALGTDPNYAVAKTALGQTVIATWDENGAVKLYSLATQADDYNGTYPPTDTGSDGLSVAKALKALGLISGYVHAFGVDDLISGLQNGPMIVGTNWYDSMETPDTHGVVKISRTAQVVGGHEWLVRGYDVDTQMFTCDNSWGPEFADNGTFYVSKATMTRLLKEDGDATLFIPANQPAPTPDPVTPTPAPAPQTDWLTEIMNDLDALLNKIKRWLD